MARKDRTKDVPEQDGAQELSPEQTEQQPASDQAGQTLREELEAAAGKAEEYLRMAQRVQADFDNYRRRNRQVASDSFEEGARAFIKTVLPVCDNLERALKEDRAGDPLFEGVLLVQRQLLDALAARGVEQIARQGEVFDPNLEDAIAPGTPEEGEPGTVCEVLTKGYRMGDFVLRHAMVRVVASK